MKVTHKSGNINLFGQVSYLCITNMQKRVNPVLVTIQDDYVTCKKCLKKIKRAKIDALVRIYNYLEKQAGNYHYIGQKDLMWWYMNGRDFFFDLHFELPK